MPTRFPFPISNRSFTFILRLMLPTPHFESIYHNTTHILQSSTNICASVINDRLSRKHGYSGESGAARMTVGELAEGNDKKKTEKKLLKEH